METCTRRPIWAGFLPSSALLLGLSSMGCQFPFSTINSPITTASSRLMSTLPYEGKGERWSSCNEPERRWLSAWLEATCSPLQGKRINIPEDTCGQRIPWPPTLPSSFLLFTIRIGSERTREADVHKGHYVYRVLSLEMFILTETQTASCCFGWESDWPSQWQILKILWGTTF